MTQTQSQKPKPELGPTQVSPSLTLAELSYQRGDYRQVRDILEQKLGRGKHNFRMRNLLGITYANLGQFEKAEAIFNQLRNRGRGRQQRDKAVFNLGLVHLYQDLARYGDLSVANTQEASPSTVLPLPAPIQEKPFSKAIHTLRALTKGKSSPYRDHASIFLSFAFLQFGDLDRALKNMMEALTAHENFFLAQYVLGRLFLDLYLLSMEGNEFLLPKPVGEFFDIEDYEITRTKNSRIGVQSYTFLDIALQAFLSGRNQSISSVTVLNYLCRTYMLADMYEEARDVLSLAESLAPEWLSTLKLSLKFQETVQAPPEVIRALIKKIETARRQDAQRLLFEILPPHFLL